MLTNEVGLITIRIDNISEAETQRLRKIFQQLLECNAFDLKAGRVILHLDKDSNLQKVEHDHIKWINRP